MPTQFIVVRGSSPSLSIYIECETCWMNNVSEPDRISTHCVSLAEAKQLATTLDEKHGARAPDRDCAHVKAAGAA